MRSDSQTTPAALVAAAALAAAMVLAAGGCAAEAAGRPPAEPLAPSTLARVQPGMTAQEAESTVGVPLEKQLIGEGASAVEVWHYRGGVLILENSRVTLTHPWPAAGT